MEEEEYKIPEYPNKEKGFLIDEEKFGQFSKDIFNSPIFAILCGIYINIIYILSWRKRMSILSVLIKLFIQYLIIEIIMKKIFKIDQNK